MTTQPLTVQTRRDPVRVLGRSFPVAGLSTGGTNIANTTVFIPTGDFARLRGPTQAYVLVGGLPVDDGLVRPRRPAGDQP